jgi:hypothetical protein
MKQTMKLVPFALLFAITACAQYQNKEPLGRDYGDAVNHNMAVQAIDPAPNLEGKEIPNMAGTRASGAIKRYDTGTVIQPVETTTTDSTFGN